MKRLLSVLGVIILCTMPKLALAQEQEVLPEEHSVQKITLELSPGLSFLIDDEDAWRPKANMGYGLGLAFQPSGDFEIKAVISDQLHTTTNYYTHPYPYMIGMHAHLKTRAVRVAAEGNWTFNANNPLHQWYGGAGIFGDIIHTAKLKKTITYVPGDQVETIRIDAVFNDVVPGMQAQIGVKAERSCWELRVWTDLDTFEVTGIPAGTLSRAFIGLNYTINLYDSRRRYSND